MSDFIKTITHSFNQEISWMEGYVLLGKIKVGIKN